MHVSIEQLEQPSVARWRVTVRDEDGSESRHVVDVPAEYLRELGIGDNEASIKDLLRRSFEFLLTKESKEAILKEFTLSDIERYFPEYKTKI